MKVLIVEDEKSSQILVKRALADYGSCTIVDNGESAFDEFFRALTTDKKFDLIVLDIELPKVDGKEVLEEIRAVEEEKGIVGADGVKVIMVTGVNDMYSVLDAHRNGCSAYLSKPLDTAKLVAELKRLNLVK